MKTKKQTVAAAQDSAPRQRTKTEKEKGQGKC